MPYLGLTGVFGAGKSTVRRMFEDLGAVGIDADAVVRRIVDRDEALRREIAARLGPEVLRPDGGLDRARTARIVFADDLKRADLEALLHPFVFSEAERLRDAAFRKSPSAVVLFEAPLLVETGYNERMDGLIAVSCPMDTLLVRLEGRGFSRREALARLRAQLGQEQKEAAADWTIRTGGSLEETRRQVEAVHRAIRTGRRGGS